jgi:hypothetical protein
MAPLKLSEDKIYQESSKGQVGGWGTTPKQTPAQPMMQTRSQAAAAKRNKPIDVYLPFTLTNELFDLGKANSYDEALSIAKKSGKVPKGFNVAVSEANEERIIVLCKKGTIVAGEGIRPAVTPPKPKPKKSDLPEKLVGPSPDAAFAPKTPTPEVPGIIGEQIVPSTFKRFRGREIDPAIGSWVIRAEVLHGPRKEVRIRKDTFFMEILAEIFRDVDFEDDERVVLVNKPLKLEDGAIYRLEKIQLRSRIALEVPMWDGCLLSSPQLGFFLHLLLRNPQM